MSDVSSRAASKKLPTSGSGKRPWSIQASLLMLLIGFIVLPVFAEIFLSFIPVILGWDTGRSEAWLFNAPLANFLFVLLSEGGTVALLMWFIKHRGIRIREALAMYAVRWRDVGYAFGGVITYFALFVVVFSVVDSVLPINTDQQQAIGFERGIGGTGLLLAFVSLVVIPPIAEELIFRGFFYGTLRRHKVRIRWSIFITSTIFAALHLLGSVDGGLLWIAFVDTFVLSIVLCYVREKTGSIWASIAIHALKNGFVFLNLFVLHVV